MEQTNPADSKRAAHFLRFPVWTDKGANQFPKTGSHHLEQPEFQVLRLLHAPEDGVIGALTVCLNLPELDMGVERGGPEHGDETVLRGGLYDAGSDVTVVLIHPFDGSSNSTDYLMAPYYAEKGYNILLPDSRDHGESGGEHVTYGLLEGSDTVVWVRWLIQRYGPDHQVILHGYDLGANAALAGAALLQQEPTLADAVRFTVAESPIVNLYDTASYLLKNQFGIPGIVVWTADRYAKGSLDGRSMKNISLADMTKGSTIPILVIQPNGDTLIDPISVALFCDNYSGECILLSPGCAHGMGYAIDGEEYTAALDEMIAITARN